MKKGYSFTLDEVLVERLREVAYGRRMTLSRLVEEMLMRCERELSGPDPTNVRGQQAIVIEREVGESGVVKGLLNDEGIDHPVVKINDDHVSAKSIALEHALAKINARKPRDSADVMIAKVRNGEMSEWDMLTKISKTPE